MPHKALAVAAVFQAPTQSTLSKVVAIDTTPGTLGTFGTLGKFGALCCGVAFEEDQWCKVWSGEQLIDVDAVSFRITPQSAHNTTQFWHITITTRPSC